LYDARIDLFFIPGVNECMTENTEWNKESSQIRGNGKLTDTKRGPILSRPEVGFTELLDMRTYYFGLQIFPLRRAVHLAEWLFFQLFYDVLTDNTTSWGRVIGSPALY
jgi:hypothetical protein